MCEEVLVKHIFLIVGRKKHMHGRLETYKISEFLHNFMTNLVDMFLPNYYSHHSCHLLPWKNIEKKAVKILHH